MSKLSQIGHGGIDGGLAVLRFPGVGRSAGNREPGEWHRSHQHIWRTKSYQASRLFFRVSCGYICETQHSRRNIRVRWIPFRFYGPKSMDHFRKVSETIVQHCPCPDCLAPGTTPTHERHGQNIAGIVRGVNDYRSFALQTLILSNQATSSGSCLRM